MEFATRTIHAGQPSEPGARVVGHARAAVPGVQNWSPTGSAALDGIREGELSTLALTPAR